ncbi:hypothetical protein PHMEG_00015907 [Phytophthora megakarya]|uniref:Uncharacterized protein n=1 Tax=Phytophthora megakarya TaxID=4795 RepID=A0A225W0B1_9STRA|nr:hypothetical protein PHMEG_00015907 [Phytophthora megakarya]
MSTSGELFLHVARIKTFVVQDLSIYKAAVHWEQCMLHGLGMLLVGASESSGYVFPLVPHAATSDLPGEKTLEEKEDTSEAPPVKRVRAPPNVAKYINDIIIVVTERQRKASAPLPPELTAGLTSHSLRRGSAAYANASPQLSIQWISTRGSWMLDSLTKTFAYVGTTTRED